MANQAPLSTGILQARIPDWVAISFCTGSSWPRDWTCIRRRILHTWTNRESHANCTSIRKTAKPDTESLGGKSQFARKKGPSVWQGSPFYRPRMLKQLVIRLKSGLPWWSRAKGFACQCRGHGSDPWSGKTPHAVEQTRSVCSEYWACAPQQEKPSPWEAYALHLESSPHAMKSEKAYRQLHRRNTGPSPKSKSLWTRYFVCLLARPTRDLWFVTSGFLVNKRPDLVDFSRSVVSNSSGLHGLQHARPPCPSPTPGAYSNSCPLSRWCHPAISSSVVPFSSNPCLQFLPASGSFPLSQLSSWGGQRIGVSASTSVLPMNTQDWSPLEWTGWICL